MDARLNRISGFSEIEATELARAQRIEEALARTKTEGGGVNADFTQAFVQWFHDTDQGPASMLNPNTVEDVTQLRELQGRFLNEEILPSHLGVWITPNLEDQFKTQEAELKDKANIAGTHAKNINQIPDGGNIEEEMATKHTELGQEMNRVKKEVVRGQKTAEGKIDDNHARVQSTVEDQQDKSKVERVIEGGVEEGREALHHLFKPNETPEEPDDWVFRQQGMSGRRDEADLGLKNTSDQLTLEGDSVQHENGSTPQEGVAGERQSRQTGNMGMPQRGNKDEGWE